MKSVKILSLIVLAIILLSISVDVFASSPIVINNSNVGNTTTNTIVINTTTNTTTNTTVINPAANITTNRTVNVYTNSNLPQTGTSDYIIIGFVLVCVASAVYAYKKVKDYQI